MNTYLDNTGLRRLWNKVKALIPTKTSELTNDSGFLTENDVQRFFVGTQMLTEQSDIAGANDGDIYIKTT